MASFLDPVIGKLVDFLTEEVVALKGVHEDVESLRDELEIIQPLLRDAEEKLETSNAVKVWVRQIRQQADRIEDVIDLYRYRLRKIRCESGLKAFLHRASHFVQTLKPRHQISSEIRSINKSLREIKDRATGYGLSLRDQPGSSHFSTEHADPRRESLFLEEDDLVGIEPARKDLVASLVGGPPERLVISLVGEGGVGKTTLCNSVFEDEAVKRSFETAHAWITVSQPYDLKKILKKMREKICKGGESGLKDVVDNTIEDLMKCLKDDLKTKRYVVVFDDVWEEKFWAEMNIALPDMKNGSRIVITTRNGSVANSCKKSPHDLIHCVEPWSAELSNELFCKKAFGDGSCPEELKKISMEIISKCQGLPLVIAAIASLLATKEKVALQWQRVLNDLNSKVELNPGVTTVQKILSLSYYDLPYSLRSCFLYFGMFPEDYSISDERLCRLWIAEGFIEPKGGRALEEVAKEYTSELVRRNLVLFDQSSGTGEGNFFRVHDLMRDVIFTRAEDLCFFSIWDAKNSKFRGKVRRVIISACSARNASENVESSAVRSLFLSNILDEDAQLIQSCMATLLKKFKLLEVLDVENALVDNVPRELGNLFCLKYLSLRNTNVKSLPKSISKLQNLHSLDIRDTFIRELPKEINKLKKLQHILAYSYNFSYTTNFDYVLGVSLQVGFGNLEELQTLTAVEVHLGGIGLMKEMEKLIKLRWLGISKLTRENGKALCAAIWRMIYLERLYIAAIDENEILDLQHLQSPPLSLRDLLLTGRLERLPEWIPELQNLCGLSLDSTKLTDDPIKSLKGLPNLDTFEILSKAYEGEELHFEEGGFLKLKRLFLYELDKLKAVRFDRRALPVLEHFTINNCRQLKEVPSVEHLKRIKLVEADGRRLN